MKALLLVMASLLLGNNAEAQSSGKREITDSFTDKINSVTEEDKTVTIKFSQHAAIYHLPKKHPEYEKLKNMLEKMQKNDQKIKVVAIIPTMEIKEIKQQ